MAKIRLTDYLKKKKKKEEILFESEEDILRRARERMEADAFIVSPAYRIENYRQAEKLVMQIPEDAEAKELREQFRRGQRMAEEEKREWDLQSAHRHYEEACTEDEFGKVRKEFAALGDYKDAKQFLEMAKQQEDSWHRRTNRKRVLRLSAAAVLILAAALLFHSGLLGYAAARLEGMAGVYISARNRFLKMGDFLDAPQQAAYYNEKYLKQRELEEKTLLSDAGEGDTVDFGDYSWTVLEREDSRLLLILKTIEKDGIFGPRRYAQSAENSLWAESSLRTYLNEDAVMTFADAEREALVRMEHTPASNALYGMAGGSQTQDLIRIPDNEEVKYYRKKKLLTSPGTDVWLCSPGHEEGTASYLTGSGLVMEYGNDVTDDSLSVIAMICVDYSKLGQ